jgi:hypothetical protein
MSKTNSFKMNGNDNSIPISCCNADKLWRLCEPYVRRLRRNLDLAKEELSGSSYGFENDGWVTNTRLLEHGIDDLCTVLKVNDYLTETSEEALFLQSDLQYIVQYAELIEEKRTRENLSKLEEMIDKLQFAS